MWMMTSWMQNWHCFMVDIGVKISGKYETAGRVVTTVMVANYMVE